MVTVSGDEFNLTGLKNNLSAVNADNYTIAGGALTIKKAYLSGLENGSKTFHVLATSYGTTVDLVVTVTVGD